MNVQNNRYITFGAVDVFKAAAESGKKSQDPSGRVFIVITEQGSVTLGNKSQKASFEEITNFVSQVFQNNNISTEDKIEIFNSFKKMNINLQSYSEHISKNSNIFIKIVYGWRNERLQKKANQVLEQGSNIIAHEKVKGPLPNASAGPTRAVTHVSEPAKISSIYNTLSILRPASEAGNFQKMRGIGGAGTVANELNELNEKNPQPGFKIGVMFASNSGQPAGKVGQELRAGHTISTKELNFIVQEESVISNVLMTTAGNDGKKQKELLDSTITGHYGMAHLNDNVTIQGPDFSKKEEKGSAHKYNQAYVVAEGYKMSNLKENPKVKGQVILGDKQCDIVGIFADSVNANETLGSKGGTMQRTLNPNAINDKNEFRACVKEKLRASLDAGVAIGKVTCPLVALLSGGIYAGKHKDYIAQEFDIILREVLNEPVGPNDELRGQYFHNVVIPILART